MTSPPAARPELAIVAPHRVAAWRDRIGIEPDTPLDADFTGWSKLAVLAPTVVVLAPRDHTHVDALRQEADALNLLADLDEPTIPELVDVVDDPEIGPYPMLVCTRLPGGPLAGAVEALPTGALGDLFEDLGTRIARWQGRPVERVGIVPRRDALADIAALDRHLDLTESERRAHRTAAEVAAHLDPALVHGDLHEGQILFQGHRPPRITGILDWQTARVDHPFVDFDLGEWGTALWRGHRASLQELRGRAWAAYRDARGWPTTFDVVFEWFHACAHARHVLGHVPFPVEHSPEVVGTSDEAVAAVRAALAGIRDRESM